MIFRPEVGIAFVRAADWFPYVQLLHEFRRARFASDPCRAALDRLFAAGLARELISPTAFEDDGLIASARAIYPVAGDLSLQFHTHTAAGAPLTLPIPLADDDIVPAVDMLRLGFRAPSADAFRAEYADLGDVFLDRITTRDPAPRPRWAVPRRPGIYRREHATLVIRSETTTLLVDPLVRHMSMPSLWAMPDTREPVDGILISHSHTDHWSPLALIERAVDPATPIVVPRVPRRSLLTLPDMAHELRTLGLHALAPAWGETIQIGDITIDILPFYGEQPTRDEPLADPALRSHGNCYRIETPQLSALILTDAGTDPAGSMVAVADASRRQRGPVDVTLACLREFASPFFGGLAMYWAVLPLGLLRDLFARYEAGRLPSTTAGPAGIAAVCAAAGARYFLPYAHGYEAPFTPITDTGWGEGEPPEATLLAALATELASLGASTQPIAWDVGDRISVGAVGLVCQRQAFD
ncbi:MAG: MBL fold metallo-hydrolase [Myxococcales bacterium]|nr:MBL fold metallo-hydrolase [Myxococcales bacterium]